MTRALVARIGDDVLLPDGTSTEPDSVGSVNDAEALADLGAITHSWELPVIALLVLLILIELGGPPRAGHPPPRLRVAASLLPTRRWLRYAKGSRAIDPGLATTSHRTRWPVAKGPAIGVSGIDNPTRGCRTVSSVRLLSGLCVEPAYALQSPLRRGDVVSRHL